MRPAYGKVRDALIGVRAVLADGTLVKGGGRVVKNVAGYDLMKLLCGSFGTLAVVVEACFRLRPLPTSSRVAVWRGGDVAAAFTAAAALRGLSFTPAVARIVAADVELDGIGRGPSLVLGVEGSAADVEAQARAIDGTLPAGTMNWLAGAAGEDVLSAARALQACTSDSGDTVGVRLSLRPSDLARVVVDATAGVQAAGLSLQLAADLAAGVCFLRLSGGNDAAMIEAIATIRARARACGGAAVLDDVPARLAERLDPWGDVGALELMRGIKVALDPQRRLGPGRFVGGI